MAHISRQFLKGDMEKKLVRAMVSTLTSKGSAPRRADICWELLTGTERLMLGKRMAIVCLLARGLSFESISEKLMVSTSTVSRINLSIEKGMYTKIVKAAQLKKSDDVLLKALLALLSLLPRDRHAPRWKHIDEIKFRGE